MNLHVGDNVTQRTASDHIPSPFEPQTPEAQPRHFPAASKSFIIPGHKLCLTCEAGQFSASKLPLVPTRAFLPRALLAVKKDCC